MSYYETLDEVLMPLDEFLAQLGISANTERKLRQQPGWPTHVSIGRKTFVLRRQVLEWLESQAVQADGAAFSGGSSESTSSGPPMPPDLCSDDNSAGGE